MNVAKERPKVQCILDYKFTKTTKVQKYSFQSLYKDFQFHFDPCCEKKKFTQLTMDDVMMT